MKELRGIGVSRAITDDELATAKDSLIQRLPGTFASVQSVNSAIVSLWTQGLPDNYYQEYASKISDIRKEDVLRVARQYIDLEHLSIVIVGDRARIEGPLKGTGIAPIVLADIEGTLK
jgi:zinc protease